MTAQRSPRVEMPKLRKSAKDAPTCFGCGRHNDGSVVLAHASWLEYGKGVGVKTSDIFGAILCPYCHDMVDGRVGDADIEDRREMWRQAHIKTLQYWVTEGILKS